MDGQVAQPLELTLRGFSRSELVARAEQQCAVYFGSCPFQVEETRCVPCVCSLGGRVRLYEARVRARPLLAQAASAPLG
jgi:hypothetical protein